MASKSNSLNPNPGSPTYSLSDGGSIKTEDGTKKVQLLTPKSKCAIAAFIIGVCVGVLIVILGTTHLFGPVGSIGYIASIAVGGTAAAIAMGGLIWTVISNCKQSDSKPHMNSKEATSKQQQNPQISEAKNDNALSQSYIAFDAKCWNHYFGTEITEPFLPDNIKTLLDEPCPYFSGKQVRETHCLVLVPGEPFTWPQLRILVPNTLQLDEAAILDNPRTVCIEEIKIQNAYWVLMLKEPVPGSVNQHLGYSLQRLSELNKDREDKDKYMMPTLREATVAILAHYIVTGERLFSTTEIYCTERGRDGNLRIGCFGTDGLHIRLHDQEWVVANRGIGVLRVL